LPPRSLLDIASCTTGLWSLLLLSLSLHDSSAFLSIPRAYPYLRRHGLNPSFPRAVRLSRGITAAAGTRQQSRTDTIRRRQTSEWMDPYEDEKEDVSGDNEILNDFSGAGGGTFQDREQAVTTTTNSKPASSSVLEQRDGEDDDKWRRRVERYERNKLLDQKAEEASAAMNLPEQPLVQTLQGGSSLIFAMAKRMWDPKSVAERDSKATADGNERVWSVTASRQEFAAIIWKNARKGNKPGMWRYAVRTFDRMMEDEKLGLTIHYEGALTACAKLGMWERALEIYLLAVDREAVLRKKLSSASKAKPRLAVRVNDNMVMSLLRACVRASRQRQKISLPENADANADHAVSGSSSSTRELQERQRIPLDAAVEILQEIETRHGLTLTARHLNPVAAAYLSLGLAADAASLLQSNLSDRTTGPEAEDGEQARFNVNDLTAKDKGSYSLLVQGAVSDADWAGAVDALTDMTEAGLYPVARNLNTWTEVSERKTKRRATRSWKKKRDESYLDSVR
jgi:hypothetical protein